MSVAETKFKAVRLLLPLLLLVLPMATHAQYTFITNADNTLTLTGYTGIGGALTLPGTNNGLTVTVIGTYVFEVNDNVTSITIPDSVTNIQDKAFILCLRLAGVSIGNGVTSIGNYAFSECELSSLTIGTNVVSIGDGAFETNFLTSITIPASVTSIGDGAFGFNPIGFVTIPAGVTNLGGNPFPGCAELETINVAPSNPAYFAYNSDLLFNVGATTLITYPAGVAGSSYFFTNTVTTIANDAFNSCPSVTNITISPYVLNIGSNAFANCTNLTNVTISASVTNISPNPFGTCTRLTNINVNSNSTAYTNVAGVLFNKSQTLLLEYPYGNVATAYIIPATVTSIANDAFLGCPRLTNVSIPNGVLNIGNGTFQNCSNLTSVTLPNSVTNLGINAFINCTNMRTLTLSDSLTSLAEGAFALCPSLTNVTIPVSVTNIGYGAFELCTGLTNITIPAGVSGIGPYAFVSCTHLFGVYFQGNAPVADPTAFNFANAATVYYLPGATGWGTNFAGHPTALWNPLIQSGGTNFGPLNNQFGFNVTGTTNLPIVIEACTNLANPVWTPLTNLNLTNGSFSFTDSQWSNYPGRYYRITAP